ncbi:limonene-1,2-epoxide hydrolase family protein [Erythrobacter oryzae]|uniref:limonene-1,2-epoxide hydrolase family protein n=1 Tax=Erythrobacter oryzae TaxID=3019556 RepID=UPI0025547026|nr:limonene-1,2-epoxide hydrolase family protein [Erythrobacter sp. COR-2]
MPDKLATVHRVISAIAAKDYDKALPFFTEDCEYTNLPMGSVIGPEGVRAVLEPFFAPTIENELVVLRSAVEGDAVFTERLDRHRLPRGWVELPVTGVFVFRERKIAVWREYFDLGTLLRQWPELAPAPG